MSIFNTARRLYRRLRYLQQRQRQRRHLLTLESHTLRDMGISRADAVREGSKRIWQP
ncbi:hypothetical protein GCM10011352_06380 [Marinobacterium zhoushanense]|uniref:YjiS-like domain-containing protein n=1 Tax=Marinobacterium zhoushanense TaxID=1679163 RepID=A0ABQ1JZP9_9GAMM|nr:DUF1127 domain-containing protein [Marinobacterium zhoushanense]GGB83260.1 hypothetical protein GCM10011352_06380 [Marinobacterium zhoushanense]